MDFPKDFLFGVADADLQVIGEADPQTFENAQASIWTSFMKTHNRDLPGLGIKRYTMWKEDIALMHHYGIANYRTSVAMNRLLTENGSLNLKALEWYKTYFKELKKRNIHIYVTLYHWELPQSLQEKGGLLNKNTIDMLVTHGKAVVSELGEYIDEYFLLNEPWCSSMLGHYIGVHAPGEKDLKKGLLAAHHLLVANGVLFEELQKMQHDIKLSTVNIIFPTYPKSNTEKDKLAAQYADGYFNRWFLDPLFKGKYPEDMVELYDKDMPAISKADMDSIKVGHKLHTLGINYYNGQQMTYDSTHRLKFRQEEKEQAEKNDLGWPLTIPPLYSEGLYDALQNIYKTYKVHGLKQLYITENGIPLQSNWDGKKTIIDDDKRIYYMKEHVRQIKKALDTGIPVKGYFAWTLMDNFEWWEGYAPSSAFGLIYVDRKTFQRVPKKSMGWYSEFLKNHKIS